MFVYSFENSAGILFEAHPTDALGNDDRDHLVDGTKALLVWPFDWLFVEITGEGLSAHFYLIKLIPVNFTSNLEDEFLS